MSYHNIDFSLKKLKRMGNRPNKIKNKILVYNNNNIDHLQASIIGIIMSVFPFYLYKQHFYYLNMIQKLEN